VARHHAETIDARVPCGRERTLDGAGTNVALLATAARGRRPLECHALALIVSPNGVILLFWPLATITFAALVGTAVVLAVRGLDRPVRDARDRHRHRSHRRVDRRPCELVLALRLPTGDRVTVPDSGGGGVTAVQVSPSV